MPNLDDDLHAAQLQTVQAIQRDLTVIAQRDQNAIDLMRDGVKELRMILCGADGTNGVRSVVKEHDLILKTLQKWQIQATTLYLIIQILGVPLLIYFFQKIIFK